MHTVLVVDLAPQWQRSADQSKERKRKVSINKVNIPKKNTNDKTDIQAGANKTDSIKMAKNDHAV